MKTFVEKQNKRQQKSSGNLAKRNALASAASHDVHPLLRLQRTMGNQAVLRMLQANVKERKVGLTETATSRLAGTHMPEVSTLDSNAVRTTGALLQRAPNGDNKPIAQSSLKEADKKAELQFRTTMYFHGVVIQGPDQVGPPPSIQPIYPEEGRGFLIAWKVWNVGWKKAPNHANRLTIYDAHFCSGCRRPEDEVYRQETQAGSLDYLKPEGKYEYEESFWVDGLPAGHYEAFAELDVNNEVEEINEDNNTQFMIFDIKPRNKL